MTQLAKDSTATPQYGTPDVVIPQLIALPVGAGLTIYGGGLVATGTDGYAKGGTFLPTDKIWGRCERQIINTVAAGYGAAGAVDVLVRQCAMRLFNSAGGNAITDANRGQLAYAVDDCTVSLTDGAGQYPACGIILGVRASDSMVTVQVGLASLYSDNDPADNSTAFKARAVATSIAAYVAAAGVLTASANGALASQDGVAMAAGDVLFIPEGIANVTAADAGPYVVTSLGGASAKFVFTRPDWWKQGGAIVQGQLFSIGGEGTVWAGTDWKSFAGTGKIVGTDAPALYPGRVTVPATLVAGTLAITSVPIRSATKTGFVLTRITPNTSTATVMYAVNGAPTPGVLGTATFTAFATVAAGTINIADISTLSVAVINF